MIHITDRAKDALLQKKEEANIQDPRVGLRITAQPTGEVALVVDRERDGDEVVVHRDSTVLVVAPDVSASVLEGRTIDCLEDDAGASQLVLAGIGGGEASDGDGTR
jgi:Fe-S cluster assembly iron-binding protein IscA